MQKTKYLSSPFKPCNRVKTAWLQGFLLMRYVVWGVARLLNKNNPSELTGFQKLLQPALCSCQRILYILLSIHNSV